MMAAGAAVANVLDPAWQRLTDEYAEALLANLGDDPSADAAADQLIQIADMLEGMDGAELLFAQGEMFREEGERLVQEAFAGKVSEPVEAVLMLMARHGRLRLLPSLAGRFRKILSDRQGITEVTVTAAVDLSPQQRLMIGDALAKVIGAAPVLTVRVEPRVLGGLVVQMGDRVYDASIASQLQSLRRRMMSSTSHKGGSATAS